MDEKINAAREADNLDMSTLVQVVYNTFSEHGFTFKMDDDAMALFKKHHDSVLNFRKSDKFDDHKAMVKTKSISNVLRVAGVQCAMRCALDIVKMGLKDINLDNVIITGSDMERSLNLVTYSVKCIFSLIDSTIEVKRKSLKRYHEMPKANDIDVEFLEKHKGKIQKIYSTAENYIVPVSVITKNHLYPQIGCKSSSEDAKTFLEALQLHGLGKYEENQKRPRFVLMQKENVITEEKLRLFNRLGLSLD